MLAQGACLDAGTVGSRNQLCEERIVIIGRHRDRDCCFKES